MFSGLFDLIAGLLAWFYSLWPSYGMAIVFLTLLVMLVMTPLTISSTRQMIKMQRLQPELKRIQNEFRHDRQRMNEEVMRFYQENKVNPVGSCLPLFIQMPVFLILFRVLRGLTRRLTDVGFQVGAIAGQIGAGSDVTSVDVKSFGQKTFDPDYLDHSTELYRNLTQQTEMVSWGIDLSDTPMDALSDSIVRGIPYVLLIVAIGVTSWLQQKQIQGRTRGSAMNPQQQMLMKFLPFFLPVVSFGFPAGLLVYFVVSSLVRIGQQAYITHVVYKKAQDEPLPAVVRSKEKAGAKGAKAGGGRVTKAQVVQSNARSTSTARRRRTSAGERARLLEQEKAREAEKAARRERAGKSGRDAKVGRGSSRGAKESKDPARPAKDKGSGRSGRVTPPGSPARPRKKRK